MPGRMNCTGLWGSLASLAARPVFLAILLAAFLAPLWNHDHQAAKTHRYRVIPAL